MLPQCGNKVVLQAANACLQAMRIADIRLTINGKDKKILWIYQ